MAREIKAPPKKIEVSRSFDSKHVIEFNEGSHRYKLNGKQCPGWTTVIKGGYPTSQGLISWQKGQALNSLFQNLTVPSATLQVYEPREGFWPISEEQRIALFKEAKAADRAVSQEAADIGSLIHEHAFLYETKGDLAKLTADIAGLPEEIRTMIANGIGKFMAWREPLKDELVGAEMLVASPTLLVCGKFDKLARRAGKLILSDYKSSKSIYLDQFIQLGGYAIAIKEWLGLDVEGFEILRFGKEDGEFETMMIDKPEEMEIFKRQAIRCRETHEFRKLENDPRWKWDA